MKQFLGLLKNCQNHTKEAESGLSLLFKFKVVYRSGPILRHVSEKGFASVIKISCYDLQTWVSWDLEIRRALDKFPTRWSRSFMVSALYWWSIFHHIYSFLLKCNLHQNWLFELAPHCCGQRLVVSIWNRSLRNLILNYGQGGHQLHFIVQQNVVMCVLITK